MRHDTSTNINNYKKDFEYLKIRKDSKEIMVSLYGNMNSNQIAEVTTYISNYFSADTDLSFDLDVDPKAAPGDFVISWS